MKVYLILGGDSEPIMICSSSSNAQEKIDQWKSERPSTEQFKIQEIIVDETIIG